MQKAEQILRLAMVSGKAPLAGLAPSAAPAAAQPGGTSTSAPPTRTLSEIALQLRDEGKLDEAFSMFERAARVKEGATMHRFRPEIRSREVTLELARTYCEMGKIREMQERRLEAVECYELALPLQIEAEGELHESVGGMHEMMGALRAAHAAVAASESERLVLLAKAAESYAAQARVARDVYGSHHAVVGMALLRQGQAEEGQTLWDLALAHYDAAFEIFDATLSEGRLELAETML